MRPVIAGIGIHPFGRFPGLSYLDIGRFAVAEALADADISWREIDVAYCAAMFIPQTSGARILSAFGLTGIQIANVEAACASGAVALLQAVEAVLSGRARYALALGVEQRPRGFIDPSGIFEPWQIAMGMSQTPMYWALWARRYMGAHGVTAEDIADVSVKNHRNGVLNPYAMYRQEVTRAQVLASKMVCDPIHLLELCAPNEGSAAVVVTAQQDGARRSSKMVEVAAVSVRTSMYPQRRAPAYSFSASREEAPETTVAAEDAFARAGLGPGDLDLVELQDADAFQELLYSEQLGLAPEGDGIKLLRDGISVPGGSLPINMSGGLLSKGEPIGASALGQIVELVMQLRGDAGQRMVPNARVGLAHVVGAAGNCGVTILKK
jgi:acetyl-CoA C-acetyltransferase